MSRRHRHHLPRTAARRHDSLSIARRQSQSGIGMVRCVEFRARLAQARLSDALCGDIATDKASAPCTKS